MKYRNLGGCADSGNMFKVFEGKVMLSRFFFSVGPKECVQVQSPVPWQPFFVPMSWPTPCRSIPRHPRCRCNMNTKIAGSIVGRPVAFVIGVEEATPAASSLVEKIWSLWFSRTNGWTWDMFEISTRWIMACDMYSGPFGPKKTL